MSLAQCFLVLLTVALLAGCGAPAAETGAAGAVVAVPEGAEAAALTHALKVYEKSTGERVRVEALPPDVYWDRLAAYLLAGRADYDLVYLPADHLARWSAVHALQPLEIPPEGQEALAPWLPLVTFEGEILAIPTQPGLEVVWYRADLLAAANVQPPRSWDDFRAAGRAAGMAVAAGPGAPATDVSPYLAGFCAPQPPWDCPAAARARALDLYREAASSGWAEADRAAVVRALREGGAGIAILPLMDAPALLDCREAGPSCDGGRSRLAWAPVPGLDGAGVGSLGAWAVPLRAGREGAGKRLALWLGSAEGAAAWAGGGGLPAYRDAARLPDAQSAYLEALAGLTSYQLGLPGAPGVEGLWPEYHAAVRQAVMAPETGDVLESFFDRVKVVQRRPWSLP